MSLLFQLKLYRSTTCFLLHTPQGGKLPLLLTPLTYIHVGNQGPCSRAQPINSPSTAIAALDSSTLSPDSFYLLHPCSRVLTRHTTATDGGSAENASLHGCSLLEQCRSNCRGAYFLPLHPCTSPFSYLLYIHPDNPSLAIVVLDSCPHATYDRHGWWKCRKCRSIFSAITSLYIVALDSCPHATYSPSMDIKKGRRFVTCGLSEYCLNI